MSESERSMGEVDGTVLQDQIEACDETFKRIQEISSAAEEEQKDHVDQCYEFYDRVSEYSIRSFASRFETSSLYDVLKAFLRKIGEECGYEHRMHYHRGETREVADNIDNLVYWFKLYAGVVLEEQPEITYEWAVPHFKEHRDLTVSHPSTIKPLQDGPEPTLVSSVVPLWFVLEDILRLWRRILDMAPEEREQREYVLTGEVGHGGGLETHRYGFVQKLKHRSDARDFGIITEYNEGEDGKSSRFEVQDVDFFPSVGDVVRFQAEQRQKSNGDDFPMLTVTGTVQLVE